jgi:hypothetical protein
MKFGIIGAGKIGYGQNKINFNSHFFNYKKKKKFKLEFLVDINKKKYQLLKKKYKLKVFQNINELKSYNKTDVLSICVPPDKTLKVLKNLKSKKLIPNYVILEKPISNNLQDLIKINKILEGKNVYINLQRIFDKAFLKLIKNEKSQSLVVHYNGGLINNGIHILTLLLYIYGRPKEIKQILNFNEINNKKDPSLSFKISFKNFEAVILGFDNLRFNKCDFEFISRNKTLILRSGGTKKIIEKISNFPNLYNYQINIPIKIGPFNEINGLKYIMSDILNKKKPISNFLKLMYEAQLIIFKMKNNV